jgi:hypothetical protein
LEYLQTRPLIEIDGVSSPVQEYQLEQISSISRQANGELHVWWGVGCIAEYVVLRQRSEGFEVVRAAGIPPR